MAIGPKLDIRQGQVLSLTPQLVQAIKLLAMNHAELLEFVEAEVEQNPFLELLEPNYTLDLAMPIVQETPKTIASDLETVGFSTIQNGEENQFDQDWHARESGAGEDSFGLSSDTPYWAETPYMDFNALESNENWAEAQSLHDVLLQQILLEFDAPEHKFIALGILEFINDAGYFIVSCNEIADRLKVDLTQVEAVLQIMQRFEPSGICARNLKECLTLQLRDKNRLDPWMIMLLDHLDLIGKKNYSELKKVIGANDEDLHDMLSELRALTPKPGLNYGAGFVQSLIPDVFVIPTPDGNFRVELNPDALPRVLVNNSYYEVVTKSGTKHDKQFMNENYNHAQWLHKSLDQRAKTIVKVSAEIVRHQEEFFRKGVMHLRPLTLRTIAEAIDMHESTVSRVTSNKYIASKRGTFEMKYFFTSAIQNDTGGEGVASEIVRQKIRHLIDNENGNSIFSDEMIAEALKKQGIDVARRTVMKYREAMGIGSSVERRRDLKMKQ